MTMPAPAAQPDPQVHAAVQLVIEGPQTGTAIADKMQRTPEVRAMFAGTLQLVIKDPAAFKSLIAWFNDIAQKGQFIWPEHDAFDRAEQRERNNLANLGTKHGRRSVRKDMGIQRGLK